MNRITGAEATIGLIDITDAAVLEFIRHCYELSRPQGMGHLHYRSGRIPDHVLSHLFSELTEEKREGDRPVVALDMDYVMGRAVKMTITRYAGRYYIQPHWHDHTDADLEELLTLCELDFDEIYRARKEQRDHFG